MRPNKKTVTSVKEVKVTDIPQRLIANLARNSKSLTWLNVSNASVIINISSTPIPNNINGNICANPVNGIDK